MEKRSVGNGKLQIAPLVFGGNVFGWTVDERTSFELLDAFAEAGFDCIDTADVYSRWVPGNHGGESETIIGNWIHARKNRRKVVIATKVGSEMGPGRKGLSKAYILSAVEDSLRRLQTDYIDLYQSHYDDPAISPDETLAAYAQLVKEGKIRVAGASNITPERLQEALVAGRKLGVVPYQSLQPLYNLYDRGGYEHDFEPICRKWGLAVLPYYSLASGYLTGKYRKNEDFAKSGRGGSVQEKYFNDRGKRILAALDEVSRRLHATPAQVAIAWLLSRPTVTAPIASATTKAQLAELLKGTELRLDGESFAQLQEAGKVD
jgi:aryl-alcohol dehydrogenase-like predicted oxidoreductase